MKNGKEILELLRKAQRSFEAVKILFSNEFFDFSISRAYYTMFYSAEALLLSKGLGFSRHSAIISYFGKEFIKEGLLPRELHLYINDAFKERSLSDYETKIVDKKTCEKNLDRAKIFLKEMKKYLTIENEKQQA